MVTESTWRLRAYGTGTDNWDFIFRPLAWLAGAGSHTANLADSGKEGYGGNRGYYVITTGAPFEKQPQSDTTGVTDFMFRTNCTTRYGYLTPGAIFNAYRFTGVGYYWNPHY